MKKNENNKSFGILFFVVFSLIAVWPIMNGGQVRFWAIVISLTFLFSLGLFASDRTAQNCEVFIDKVVPIKVHFHNRNTTYTKFEIYLKASEEVKNQIKDVNFYRFFISPCCFLSFSLTFINISHIVKSFSIFRINFNQFFFKVLCPNNILIKTIII